MYFLRVSLLLIRWLVFLNEKHGVVVLGFLCWFASLISVLIMQFLVDVFFTECNDKFLWELVFKVDVVFNILISFFLELFWINFSVLDARLWPLLSCRFGVFDFLIGICHGFLLTYLLWAFSVWRYRNVYEKF